MRLKRSRNEGRTSHRSASERARRFPTSAGILFGIGMGGFFDGIVLHQILQWHHMLSSAHPVDSLAALQLNILWDGLFHASTYIFIGLGLLLLWRNARKTHGRWSGKSLVGTMLMGFGAFNVVEGLVDHQLLGLHHVNEGAPREQWIYWDGGFIIWGAAMVATGFLLFKQDKQQAPRAA